MKKTILMMILTVMILGMSGFVFADGTPEDCIAMGLTVEGCGGQGVNQQDCEIRYDGQTQGSSEIKVGCFFNAEYPDNPQMGWYGCWANDSNICVSPAAIPEMNGTAIIAVIAIVVIAGVFLLKKK